jgi:hypothetical protein
MLHDWNEFDDREEALGLRVLLRAALPAEEYEKATKARCIKLGQEEQERVARIAHEKYMAEVQKVRGW